MCTFIMARIRVKREGASSPENKSKRLIHLLSRLTGASQLSFILIKSVINWHVHERIQNGKEAGKILVYDFEKQTTLNVNIVLPKQKRRKNNSMDISINNYDLIDKFRE